MDNQYFKRDILEQPMWILIDDIKKEMEKSYFSRIMGSMNLKSHGIEILDDDNLSRVFVDVRDPHCLFFLDIDLETKTFTIEGLSDDDENIFSLIDFVSSLRLVASGKPRKTSAELDVEFEQMEERNENENIKTAPAAVEVSSEVTDDFEIEIEDDDGDEDAGDFEDGIDDIFEMELAEIDDAQCSLRLEVRQQLRSYPHVKINDMRDGELVSEDEEWDYINQEVQLEGRNFEDADEPFTAFEVPITLFGDHFTLCFSPYDITARQANTILNIPAATEFHVVLNSLIEFLSDEAKRRASEWRKQQVLSRLEKKQS